jgi:hypothetical protein
MARFLIEVPHEAGAAECLRAVEIFLRTGSHFLSRADWGCLDGDHAAWMIIDVETKDEARAIVPSAYRAEARIVELNTFTMAQVAELRSQEGV